ncbi:hypothetical protein MBLNU13_g01141t1 [Cladosporium sp. NU13]
MRPQDSMQWMFSSTSGIPAQHSSGQAVDHVSPTGPQSVPGTTEPDESISRHPKDDSLETMDWLETIVMGHWIPSAVPAALRADIVRSEQTDASPGQGPMTFGEQLNTAARDHITLRQNPNDIDLRSYLPPKAEAFSLFRYYCDNLDFHFHAVVPHQVEKQIEVVYERQSRHQRIDLNHAALLFSILASALHYRLQPESSIPASAYSQAAVFLSGAALIQSNYMAYPTLEGLQATMIVVQIYRAINMSLHLVDSPCMRQGRSSGSFQDAGVELKRRIWWSLVSNDWLLAYLSGPQEWTYSVNPDHMNVDLPRNIEDMHIDSPDTGQPLSTPTAMSYTLCRVQLAFVSRQIVDETAVQHFHGKEIPYEKIIELDHVLRDSLEKLPEFYRFGHAHKLHFATLYQERPVFAWQRSMLQLGYHHRICRLHRQHFIRGAKDPKYSSSHISCLRSARTIIEIKRVMDEDEPVMEPSSSMVWAVMHHVFMAAVILLVDVCFNWEDVLAEKRKEEVIDACRMLTRAQRTSPVARRAVDAMMDILRKHWTQERGLRCPRAEQRCPKTSARATVTAAQAADAPASVPTPDSMFYASTSQAIQQDSLVEVPLEDIWAEMLDGSVCVGLDTPDWTELLNDLTHAGLPGA